MIWTKSEGRCQLRVYATGVIDIGVSKYDIKSWEPRDPTMPRMAWIEANLEEHFRLHPLPTLEQVAARSSPLVDVTIEISSEEFEQVLHLASRDREGLNMLGDSSSFRIITRNQTQWTDISTWGGSGGDVEMVYEVISHLLSHARMQLGATGILTPAISELFPLC